MITMGENMYIELVEIKRRFISSWLFLYCVIQCRFVFIGIQGVSLIQCLFSVSYVCECICVLLTFVIGIPCQKYCGLLMRIVALCHAIELLSQFRTIDYYYIGEFLLNTTFILTSCIISCILSHEHELLELLMRHRARPLIRCITTIKEHVLIKEAIAA